VKQDEALALMEAGHSVLLTGAAGSGKTYTLNQFVRRAKRQGKSVAITATTGLAATHLNGTTIHAWSGIGVHHELHKQFFTKMSKQRQDLIRKADVLIIDEISMLHDFRLDLVEEVTRSVRGGERPFGGLQVILCGDFFQLPPVNRRDEAKQGGFITGSQTWQVMPFTVCYLEEQHRQKSDQDYTDILNGIRAGVLKRSQLDMLQARTEAVVDPWTTQTRLLTTNVDVDGINQQHLDELAGDTMEYEMTTAGGKKFVEQLLRSCLAPQTLQLKKDAQVMCIKNSSDKKYVNGSLGVVVDFEKNTNFPKIELTNGKIITVKPETWELRDVDKKRAEAVQLPLRLAWAITVHKSQGMTLDAARIDLRRAFVEGMGYVALSRVKGIKHLQLDGLNGMALRVSPVARQIDQELRQRSKTALEEHAKLIEDWREAEKNRKPEDEKKVPKAGTWSEKLEKMRAEYPNAYRPWKEGDDEKLTGLFDKGKSVKELIEVFQRHPGSIRARLKKLLGDEIFEKSPK